MVVVRQGQTWKLEYLGAGQASLSLHVVSLDGFSQHGGLKMVGLLYTMAHNSNMVPANEVASSFVT